jgi:transposase
LFLELRPPYSPDLNPIEMAFAKLKAHPRRLEARSFERLIEALGSICALFTSAACENYFRAAGYAPD